MPSEFAALDTSFPDLEGKTTEEKLQTMTDYLYQLLEQLRYTLHNLGVENLNPASLDEIGKKISEPIYAEITDETEGLSTRITANSTAISTEVTRATGAEGTLGGRITQNADAITAEVTRATGAEGALGSRITQNADAITAEVSRATGAEGTLGSRITQNADAITAEVTRATGAEGALGSRITQTADAVTAEVTRATGAESLIRQSADAIKAQVTDGQGNYTVLNLKSDGLHVGNAAGTSTISGGSITANSITLNQLGADVTGSFGDDNPDYIKNTYIDFRQVQSPAVYAGDFYGGKYHDADGASTLDITSASTWWRLLFGDSSGSGLADTSFAIDADPIAGSAKLYLAGKHVMSMAFSVNDNVLNLEVPLWLPTALRLGNSGTNWGSTLPTGLTAADVGRVFFQI